MVAPPCDSAWKGFFYAPICLMAGQPRASFDGWPRFRGKGCRNPGSREEFILPSSPGDSGMLPIRNAPSDTAGILCPSLCPTGYDPVLEQDILVSVARSWRRHYTRSALNSHREVPIDSTASGLRPAQHLASGGASFEGCTNKQTPGAVPGSGPNDHHATGILVAEPAPNRTVLDRNRSRGQDPHGITASLAKDRASRDLFSGSRTRHAGKAD